MFSLLLPSHSLLLPGQLEVFMVPLFCSPLLLFKLSHHYTQRLLQTLHFFLRKVCMCICVWGERGGEGVCVWGERGGRVYVCGGEGGKEEVQHIMCEMRFYTTYTRTSSYLKNPSPLLPPLTCSSLMSFLWYRAWAIFSFTIC